MGSWKSASGARYCPAYDRGTSQISPVKCRSIGSLVVWIGRRIGRDPLAAHSVNHPVRRRPAQPVLQVRGGFDRAQASVKVQEYFLRNVFGRSGIVQRVVSQAVNHRLILLDQFREGGAVGGSRSGENPFHAVFARTVQSAHPQIGIRKPLERVCSFLGIRANRITARRGREARRRAFVGA